MPIFICYPNEKKKDVKIIADIHSSIYTVEVIDAVWIEVGLFRA